jgi:hypothetical protein
MASLIPSKAIIMSASLRYLLVVFVSLFMACKNSSNNKKYLTEKHKNKPVLVNLKDTSSINDKAFKQNIKNKVSAFLNENAKHSKNCVFNKLDSLHNVTQDLEGFVFKRYGAVSARASEALKILLRIYHNTPSFHDNSLEGSKPHFKIKSLSEVNSNELKEALELFLEDREFIGESDNFRLDIVELAGQILSGLSKHIHKEMRSAFEKKDLKVFDTHKESFLMLLRDADRLLRTREEFSFGKWIADTRSFGETDFYNELMKLEINRIHKQNSLEAFTEGDEVDIVLEILEVYRPLFEEYINLK